MGSHLPPEWAKARARLDYKNNAAEVTWTATAAFIHGDLLLFTRSGKPILPVFALFIRDFGEQNVGNCKVMSCG
ncbi:hypothetical protein SAMN05444358_1011012 [Ruegeria halocynthiae]|uniref:Uncharacterized protein n=1 Tax=Ruegeria halocynthiae TaxID=985054 RepID=A0A1H2U426_9RHOB|nr:hypothetical protein SAMN05444358_1011012 [Ruegeria halocynthiae]